MHNRLGTRTTFGPLILVLLLLSACAPGAGFLEATNRDGVPIRAARDLQMELWAGMRQQEVQALYGRPNTTGLHTCGTATPGGAWTCLQWDYRWTQPSGRVERLVFWFIEYPEYSGEWVVNSWSWY